MKLTELKLWNCLSYEIVKLHLGHYLNQRNVAISHRKTAAFQSTHLIEFRNVPTSLISINLVFRWWIWITVLQSSTMLLELYKKINISRPVTTYFHLHRQSWPNIIFSLWYDFHFWQYYDLKFATIESNCYSKNNLIYCKIPFFCKLQLRQLKIFFSS